MPLPSNEHERMGYAPQYWVRAQNEQDQLRLLLIEWLEGKRTPQMIAAPCEAPHEVAKDAARSLAAKRRSGKS